MPLKKLGLVVLFLWAVVASAAPTLPNPPSPTKLKLVRARQQALDLTGARAYDHFKWRRQIAEVEAWAAANPPRKVREVKDCLPDGDSLKCSLVLAKGGEGYLIVSLPFDDVVRIQAGVGQRPRPLNSAMPISSSTPARFELGPSTAAVANTVVTARINFRPFRLEVNRGGRRVVSTPASDRAPLAVADRLCRLKLTMTSREVVLGGGERFSSLNLNGDLIINHIEDSWQSTTGATYLAVPFYLSEAGYGALLNTYARGRLDFRRSGMGEALLEVPLPDLDCLIFTGPPLDVIDRLTAVTGRPRRVPRWSLEPWISRHQNMGWFRSDVARAEVDRMLAEGFPLGVVMYEHMTMLDENGVNQRPNRIEKPDAPELIDYWHSLGLKVIGYHRAGMYHTTPGNLEYYGFYQRPELLVRKPDGSPFIGGWKGDKIFIDHTNPAALAWAWDQTLAFMFASAPGGGADWDHLDLDGMKIDFCEYFPDDHVPLLMNDRVPGERQRQTDVLAAYFLDRLEAARPGGILWNRGGGMAANRGGIVWGGDRGRTFRQLRTTVYGALNLGASGVALWGHDLGGYAGGGIDQQEVYSRAAAFACFSPFFQDHGNCLPPWEQSGRGKDTYRFYARLRYNLIPYLERAAEQAATDGRPIVRHLGLVFPDDPAAWRVDDQYMLGDDLLVAPVMRAGARSRKVYLPEGEWVDFWTRTVVKGPGVVKRLAPLDVIPVYARAGAVIPVQLNEAGELGGAFRQQDKDRLQPGTLDFRVGAGR